MGEQHAAPTSETQMRTEISSPVKTDPSSSASMGADADASPANGNPGQDSECKSDSQILAVQSTTAAEEDVRMQVSASEEPAEREHVSVVSAIAEEQRRREPTPEELANLGKAVDMVQARSCQLSPSLLTVGQTPPDMDSPARHAFDRGKARWAIYNIHD